MLERGRRRAELDLMRGRRQVAGMTDCQYRRMINHPEASKPTCNEDGSYRIYQCDPMSRTWKPTCWCAYENGQMVKGW